MKKLLVYLVLAMLVFAVGCDINTKATPPATPTPGPVEPSNPDPVDPSNPDPVEPPTQPEEPSIPNEKMPEGLYVDDITLSFAKAPSPEFSLIKPLAEGEKILSKGQAYEFESYQDFSATGGKFSVQVKLSDAADLDKAHIWIEFFDKEITVPADNWKLHALLKEQHETINADQYVDFVLDVKIPEGVKPEHTKFKVELANEATGTMTIKDVKFIPNEVTKVNLLPFASFERKDFSGKWKVTVGDPWEDPVPEDVLKDGKNKAIELNMEPKTTMTNLGWIYDSNNGVMIPKDSELVLSMKVLSKDNKQIHCLLKEKDGTEENYTLDIEGMNKWQTVTIPSNYVKKLDGENFEVQLKLL